MMRRNAVGTHWNEVFEIARKQGMQHKKPALTYHIEIIGLRSDGCSRYGLTAPLAAFARQNGGGRHE